MLNVALRRLEDVADSSLAIRNRNRIVTGPLVAGDVRRPHGNRWSIAMNRAFLSPRAATRRAAAKEAVLGVIGVLAVGIAVYMFVTSRGGEDRASSDVTKTGTNWVCVACKNEFVLSAADVENMMEKRQILGGKGSGLVAKCSKCGEMKAEKASKCASCGKMTPSETEKCIHCGK